MTLTHIIPSLRRSLPDPLDRDRWPEFTVVSTTDVSVAGVSMLRLVDWCATPCVHTAAAVIAGTNGRPSETDLASVVVVRVLAVGLDATGCPAVCIDGELAGCQADLSEIRLIGRASTAHTQPMQLVAVSAMVLLPSDLAIGDLLAVPCRSVATLRDLRRHGAG